MLIRFPYQLPMCICCCGGCAYRQVDPLIKNYARWQGRLHYKNGFPRPAPKIFRVVAILDPIRTTSNTTPEHVPWYVVPQGFGSTAAWLDSCARQLFAVAPSNLRLASAQIGFKTLLIGRNARSNRIRQSYEYRIASLLGARVVWS